MRLRVVILFLFVACALASPAQAEALPLLSVSDETENEGDSGTGNVEFDVTLHVAALLPVTVNLSTEDGSATSPGDYAATPSPNQVTLNPGDTKPVTVQVNGDTTDEPDETFKLKAASQNPLVDDAEGTGTITDDDGPPSLTIGDPLVSEGSSGTPPAAFPVTLSAASGKPVSVDYATQDGSAEQPGDYAQTSGTLSFDPGQTQKTVSVPVVADTLIEPTETFKLLPNNPQNVMVAADEEGVATILSDDFVNQPPIARLDVTPQLAYVGKVVEFRGSRSRDPDGRPLPLQYTWDLEGNGSFETPTGTESAIGIAFFGPGTQFVGLRVSDGARFDDEVGSVQIFPAPPDVTPDTTAPSTDLVSVRRSLRRALRRGLRVRFGCSEACFIEAAAGVGRATGRRVGLRGRRRTMARAFSAMPKAGSKVLTFKLSRHVRRRLSKAKKLRVNLRFAVRDPAFNKRIVNHKVTLRR